MQISRVKKEELAMLISGLRAVWFPTEVEQQAQAKLLAQLEGELSQRYGLMLREGAD
jgi:hypothetical protein